MGRSRRDEVRSERIHRRLMTAWHVTHRGTSEKIGAPAAVARSQERNDRGQMRTAIRRRNGALAVGRRRVIVTTGCRPGSSRARLRTEDEIAQNSRPRNSAEHEHQKDENDATHVHND